MPDPYCGIVITAARREVLDGGHIKGSMMSAHLRWVKEQRSPVEQEQFWNALPRDVHQRLSGMILPVNWYDFADLIAVDRVIVDRFGLGSPTLLREVGAYSARLNLSGVYKKFTRSSVHAFLENGARLHGNFQDFGSVQYVKTGITSGNMIHTLYSSYSPLYCESAIGYYLQAVTMHDVQDVVAVETRCQCRGDQSCTFVIRWR